MATKALFNTVVNWFILQRMDQIEHFIKYPVETQEGLLFSQLFHAEEPNMLRNMVSALYQIIVTSKRKFRLSVMKTLSPTSRKQDRGRKMSFGPDLLSNLPNPPAPPMPKANTSQLLQKVWKTAITKPGKIWWRFYVNNHPESELFQHKNLRLGGSAEMYQDFNTKLEICPRF